MPYPTHASVSDAESSDASEVQGIDSQAEYKGFIDVVELHTLGSSRGIEVMPVEEFVPSKRKKGATAKAANNVNAYKDYALVLRRVWEQNKKTPNLLRIDLEIQSERLCKAYREIAADCYDEGDYGACPIKMRTPFRNLFFHRHAIKALAHDDTIDEDLRRDANVLDDFVENNGLLRSIVHDYNKFAPEGTIPSEILWTVFRPNGLVVVDAGGIKECWICRDVQINNTWGGYKWIIVGLRVGYNGHQLGLERKSYSFPSLGQKLCTISDLPVVPVEYCRDWPEIKKTLVQRSAHQQDIFGPRFDSFKPQMYHGVTWDRDPVFFDTLVDSTLLAEQIDERVMVDFQGMRKGHAPPPGFIEMIRIKARQSKAKTRETPRGMLFLDVVVPPPPRYPLQPPGMSRPPPRMPPSAGPGHPAYPNIVDVPVYHSYQPPRSQRHRRGRRARSAYSSDSDSDSDSEWELTGYDTPTFDPENNAGLMEYRTFGSSQDAKEVVDTHEDDLSGLCRVAEDVYHISEDDFQLLFPALIPAFGLKGKKWLWVLSDKLEDIKWNMAAFEALQLEGGTKDLIQALVRGHKSKAAFDDVIPGKGQGLVFLLHGKPGLGKTLTAESVADYLERPLYTIEGGELSTNAADLETDLNGIFDLTRRWDAVMLLDEADVLLCKRKSSEMDRNAVVAVFLRKIEYLQGVLFLTTNRRRDFDDAFKSRIHLTVSYPDLSEVAQSAIWKRLIATNMDVKVDSLWSEEAFAALGKLGLNGRTIRNFLRTAVSFAHSRDEALGVGHVLEIIQTELKGEGFNVFSLTAEEHAGLAKTHEALNELQRLVDYSEAQ